MKGSSAAGYVQSFITLLIILVIDSKLYSSLDLFLILFVELIVKLLNELDHVIELIILQTAKFACNIASYLLFEAYSLLVQFIYLLVIGVRFNNVRSYVIQHAVNVQVNTTILSHVVAVRCQESFKITHCSTVLLLLRLSRHHL